MSKSPTPTNKKLYAQVKAAAKKKFWKDVREIGTVIAVLVLLIPMCLALLISYLTR